MLKRVLRQYKIPWIGGFKETLSQVAFWISMINFIMMGGTFYYTTLRYIAPWFSFPIFLAIVTVIVLIGLVIEYKFIVPSLWIFRGRQMFEHQSEITEKLDEILKLLKEEK